MLFLPNLASSASKIRNILVWPPSLALASMRLRSMLANRASKISRRPKPPPSKARGPVGNCRRVLASSVPGSRPKQKDVKTPLAPPMLRLPPASVNRQCTSYALPTLDSSLARSRRILIPTKDPCWANLHLALRPFTLATLLMRPTPGDLPDTCHPSV